MDSTGLTALLTAHRRAQARGHTIRLVCPAGPVLRVLRLTGMEKVVSVYSSLAEAVAAQDADAD